VVPPASSPRPSASGRLRQRHQPAIARVAGGFGGDNPARQQMGFRGHDVAAGSNTATAFRMRGTAVNGF
jgi:hypothetical protein